MAKMSKEQSAYLAGMEYAYKIAKDGGCLNLKKK